MKEILLVTGLPRSGTSLMMQIVHKAGIEVLSDGQRQSDISNPEGYYELEAVKKIVTNNSFLKEAEGKAIKIVAPLPLFIDQTLSYKVIFMNRSIEEVLKSQEIMLNKDQQAEREKFATIFSGHIEKTQRFFTDKKIPFIEMNYTQLIQNPEEEIARLVDFLAIDVDQELMLSAIKPELYRNKNESK
jgi:hypothetical protein